MKVKLAGLDAVLMVRALEDGEYLAVAREDDPGDDQLEMYRTVMDIGEYTELDPLGELDEDPGMVDGDDVTLDLWTPRELATDGGEVENCPECGSANFYQQGGPGTLWCEDCEREYWREGEGDWWSCDASGEPERVVTDGGEVTEDGPEIGEFTGYPDPVIQSKCTECKGVFYHRNHAQHCPYCGPSDEDELKVLNQGNGFVCHHPPRGDSETPKCSECGDRFGEDEVSYAYEQRIVCHGCYGRLRGLGGADAGGDGDE